MITLAIIRYDLEARKNEQAAETDGEEQKQRQDVRDMVAEVTSAIAPFLLPLVDSLSRITGEYEPLSAIAGEAGNCIRLLSVDQYDLLRARCLAALAGVPTPVWDTAP
jgi:hypothetical protein